MPRFNQNFFPNISDLKQLIIDRPGYYDLRKILPLMEKIKSTDLGESYSWYQVFQSQWQGKFEDLYDAKIKVLVINGMDCDYSTAFIENLVCVYRNISILNVCVSLELENFLQNYSKSKLLAVNSWRTKKNEEKINLNFNEYDLVISLGVTEEFLNGMQNPVTSKNVLIDLVFVHSLKNPDNKLNYIQNPLNKIYIYTCQEGYFNKFFSKFIQYNNIAVKAIPYMPVFFKNFPVFNVSNFLFDIAILGVHARRFEIIKNNLDFFKGFRLLFITNNKYSAVIDEIKDELNALVMPSLQHGYYAKLLALSKIVYLPYKSDEKRVYKSVSDSLGLGKAVITSDNIGIKQITNKISPLITVDNQDNDSLREEIDNLLNNNYYRIMYEKRALAYARKHLNINLIYYNIFKDIACKLF